MNAVSWDDFLFRVGDGTARGEKAGVSLALLEPQFHQGFGRWYCDIGLHSTGAFRIGVQLHLARFQNNAMAGCKLSKTVRADAFMLHQPWTFSATRRGGKVEVVAAGPAYDERAPMTLGLHGMSDDINTAARAAEPLIVAELEQLNAGGEPLPVLNEAGQLVFATSGPGITPERGDGGNPRSGLPKGWKRWTLPLTIPPGELTSALAVRISLASAHANSRAALPLAGGPRHDGPLVYLPEPLVVRIDLPQSSA